MPTADLPDWWRARPGLAELLDALAPACPPATRLPICTERDLLLTELAPHLVRPVPFLFPLRHRVWERCFIGAGIALYDTLASLRRGPRALPWHRHLSRANVAKTFPALRDDAVVGAIEYWDANVDDARLVVSVLRTAVGHGANAASRTQVVGLLRDAQGRVEGAELVDLETGERFPVKARSVISSTGVWTERVQSLADDRGGLKVLASKGAHIVVPRERIQGESGLILQTATSVLFVIPWSRYWIIGTTDTPWTEGLTHPVPTAPDIDYVLGQANSVLAEPISRDDIVGTFAGLRPLLQPGTKDGTTSAKVSREHTVASTDDGLISIAGGKLTTYRVMAEDVIDFALGVEGARQRPSVTRSTPLVGAESTEAAIARLAAAADRYGWTAAQRDHLAHRYGAEVERILALCNADPTAALPLVEAPAYLRAEIVFALREEGALHLDDLVERRTRIDYEYPDHGAAALPEIAEIAAAELGWSQDELARELQARRAALAAAETAASLPDDASAWAARVAAGDLVPTIHAERVA